MQIRYRTAEWPGLLDGEPGGEGGDAPEVLARTDVVAEIWDDLLRSGDNAHAPTCPEVCSRACCAALRPRGDCAPGLAYTPLRSAPVLVIPGHGGARNVLQAGMECQVPARIGGSWYWAVLLLLVMTMTGATIFGIAMNVL